MNIIPAIDLIDGKCVRLSKGAYPSKKVYNEHPLSVARAFEDHGMKHLHLVDLDGARSRRVINHKILGQIATKTKLHIDFSGGLQTKEDLNIALQSGAERMAIGSVAAKTPALFLSWVREYGADQFILSADCKGRKIAVDGWCKTTEWDILTFIRQYETKGITNVICTDISKDGMLQGPSFSLYKEILARTKITLTASGGISTIDEIHQLKAIGCKAVVIGKAIYENKITLQQLSRLC